MKISVKGGEADVKIYADPSATKALIRSMISYMIRLSDGRGEIAIKCIREDNTALFTINHRDIKSPSDKSSIISIEKCKEVASSMGGSISADYNSSNGTTIKIKLPAVM